jgi:hypothetical protein
MEFQLASPRIDAARNGERKYIGKPCKSCGQTDRYVINAACVCCTKKASNNNALKVKEMIEQAKAGA